MEVSFNQIRETIKTAEQSEEPLDTSVLKGYSGKNVVRTLQGLCRLYDQQSDGCYLEIGVFQGLTLLSAAQASGGMPCYGIDNFKFFDPEKKNLSLVNKRKRKLGVTNAHIINLDYEDALENLQDFLSGRKIDIFFVDGPHDYRSQLMCLVLALPHLSNKATIVIDDCNYRHVRQANRDFLTAHPEFTLLFESYTHCHPHNMNQEDRRRAIDGWWNGVNIIIKDQNGQLMPKFPPTERNRNLFENEHIIHASRIAYLAPMTLTFFNNLFAGRLLRSGKAFIKILLLYLKDRKLLKRYYAGMNTHSEFLPTSHYNVQQADLVRFGHFQSEKTQNS